MTTDSNPLTRPCPHCGQPLQTLHAQLSAWVPAEIAALPVTCDCPTVQRALAVADEAIEAERRRQKLQARRAASGMPEGYVGKTFQTATINDPTVKDAYKKAADWCRATLTGESTPPGLYIAGSVGTGKTYLAACCANHLLRAGKWVKWRRYGDILREIRETYSARTSEEAHLIRLYGRKTGILVIDDLGKDKSTEWAVERLYDIIDMRYSHDLPTIVTTNYGGPDLIDRITPRDNRGGKLDDTTARAIVDRLREMSRSIVLAGKSLRARPE